MIKVFVNNVEFTIEQQTSLSHFLENNSIAAKQCAIAINSTIVSKSLWDATWLNDGDKILIIKAVQGG